MRIQILFAFLVSFVLYSCSCEKEEEVEKLDGPAWAADKFYKAFTEKDFEEAASYADKSTRRTLEFISYWSDGMVELDYIKVDSCDEYEKHAYCYCRFEDKDSSEVIDKLLVRKVEEDWLVHYEEGGNLLGENVLYDETAEINRSAPTKLPIVSEAQYEDISNISEKLVSTISHDNFVIGFLMMDYLYDIDPDADATSDYSDDLTNWDYLNYNTVQYKYYFNYDHKMSSYEVTIMNSEDEFAVYQGIIEALIEEYGTPYNAKDLKTEDLYKYKEIRWLIKGYNEELIINNEYSSITITLLTAI